MWAWIKKIKPEKVKNDSSVSDISDKIARATGKLHTAIEDLDTEVSVMKTEREAMTEMLNEAVAIVRRKK